MESTLEDKQDAQHLLKRARDGDGDAIETLFGASRSRLEVSIEQKLRSPAERGRRADITGGEAKA